MLSPAIQSEVDARTEEFRSWLVAELSRGRQGTNDLRLVVDHRGRTTLLYRLPWRNISKELLDEDGQAGA